MPLGLGGTVAAGLLTGAGMSILGGLFEPDPVQPDYPEPADPPAFGGTIPLAGRSQMQLLPRPQMSLPPAPELQQQPQESESWKRLDGQYMAMGGFGA